MARNWVQAQLALTMLSIGASALALLDRASKVRGIADQIKGWVSGVVPSQKREVRVLLERLCRRVQALAQPLQFCWLWSQNKGSSVSESVYHGRRLLCQVDAFVREWAEAEKKRGRGQADAQATVTQLREFLSELDFCVNTLCLSMHIVNAAALQQRERDAAVSPASLLRASRRVCEMHGSGGDVVVIEGWLFERRLDGNPDAKVQDAKVQDAKAEDAQIGGDAKAGPRPIAPAPSPWTPAFGGRVSVMRVVRDARRQRYQLRVDMAPEVRAAAGDDGDVAKPDVESPNGVIAVDISSSIGLRLESSDSMPQVVQRGEIAVAPGGPGWAEGAGPAAAVEINKYGFRWDVKMAGKCLGEKVFVVHDSKRSHMTPIDIFYVAKLCQYENDASADRHQAAAVARAGARSSQPLHMAASDEELVVLFEGCVAQPVAPAPRE